MLIHKMRENVKPDKQTGVYEIQYSKFHKYFIKRKVCALSASKIESQTKFVIKKPI
jgi:hypothetical protein